MSDVKNWDEITIRTPGWKARPEQVADFLRAVFPEDVILPYQQRVAEAGLREAVEDMRRAFALASERNGGYPKDVTMLVEGLLNMLDPDHEKFDGYFPSKMVCPHHGQPESPGWNPVRPVMRPCPGYPYCRAGAEIRQTQR